MVGTKTELLSLTVHTCYSAARMLTSKIHFEDISFCVPESILNAGTLISL